MKYTVLNKQGQAVKDLNLADSIFAIEPHQHALYEVVRAQRLAMKQGTHDVKNRGEVSGGGKKPYRQKGTGRARQGSIRSGQWVGGGTIFGPTPRSYNVKINKKVRRLALKSALAQHAQNNTLVIVDDLKLNQVKTSEFAKILNNLKIDKKVFVVDHEFCQNAVLSARNIDIVEVLQTVKHMSVYEILNCKYLLVTESAINEIEEALA